MSDGTGRRSGPPVRQLSNAAAKLVGKFARVHAQLVVADEKVRRLQDDRAALVVAAREMTPPITHRALADAVGLTPAAVVLMERRYRKANPKETPHS